MSYRFSTNSEASASELVENHEDMFPRYYKHSDAYSEFKIVCRPSLKVEYSQSSTYYYIIIVLYWPYLSSDQYNVHLSV